MDARQSSLPKRLTANPHDRLCRSCVPLPRRLLANLFQRLCKGLRSAHNRLEFGLVNPPHAAGAGNGGPNRPEPVDVSDLQTPTNDDSSIGFGGTAHIWVTSGGLTRMPGDLTGRASGAQCRSLPASSESSCSS